MWPPALDDSVRLLHLEFLWTPGRKCSRPVRKLPASFCLILAAINNQDNLDSDVLTFISVNWLWSWGRFPLFHTHLPPRMALNEFIFSSLTLSLTSLTEVRGKAKEKERKRKKQRHYLEDGWDLSLNLHLYIPLGGPQLWSGTAMVVGL